ncbi:MAG: energy transducer TonB, partial [Caulobacteraceae bacterium]
QPARPAAAPRGPARAETAPAPRVDAGQGVSQSDLQGLQQLLERLWNPNCGVEGGGSVIVPVKFQVGDDGAVVGRVTDRAASSDPVVFAAARRAIDAVHQAEPYAAAYRGKSFTVNFDAKKACAER